MYWSNFEESKRLVVGFFVYMLDTFVGLMILVRIGRYDHTKDEIKINGINYHPAY